MKPLSPASQRAADGVKRDPGARLANALSVDLLNGFNEFA